MRRKEEEEEEEEEVETEAEAEAAADKEEKNKEEDAFNLHHPTLVLVQRLPRGHRRQRPLTLRGGGADSLANRRVRRIRPLLAVEHVVVVRVRR
jgi:hypothetical protein